MHLVHGFPEARTCPPDTLRALRAIDPALDVLYLGPCAKGGRWLVGSVQPDVRLARQARGVMDRLVRVPPVRRGYAWFLRWRIAALQLQGFRQTAIYECPEPGGQVVFDLQRADFLHRHTTANEFWQQMDDASDAEQRATLADLTDDARAREAWKYAFTRSHMPSASLQSTARVSSAVTTHSIPSTAA